MTVIAIDGPAGAGKSSVARDVARSLDLLYVDTGAMYRGLALAALDAGVDPNDGIAIAALVPRLELDANDGSIRLDGADVDDRIRSTEVTTIAPVVARHPAVRDALVDVQRKLAGERDVVMEGRDIGTEVFPGADVKIYLTASLEERARRRLAQSGGTLDEASVRAAMQDIERRDHSDRTRAAAPLRQAADAVVLDTTDMTACEVVERIRAIARDALDRGERG